MAWQFRQALFSRYSQGGVRVPTGGKARERPFESQVSADQV